LEIEQEDEAFLTE